jgi:hypothetical protein
VAIGYPIDFTHIFISKKKLDFYRKRVYNGCMMKVKEEKMKNIEIRDVRLGDVVRWESAAGTMRGEVVSMDMAPTAAGDYVPWYTIKSWNNSTTRLCGRASYLTMMKFEVIFRDPIVVAA